MEAEEFEPILSDEEIVDDDHFQEMDYDYSAYTNNEDLIKLFTPGSSELRKYKKNIFYLLDEKLPGYIHLDEDFKMMIGIADDLFKSSLTKYTLNTFEGLNVEIKEEFIHLCEKITQTFTDVKCFCAIVELYARDYKMEDEVKLQIEYIVETMREWLQIALDFDMANAQNQPGYKIRHIKCGVRLAEWCCGSVDFIELLWKEKYDIHQVLIDLYGKEYMALSIKLMILRALDELLLKKRATERFISDNKSEENGFHGYIPITKQNGYEILVELMRKNPSVRLKFALNSILKKLNLFELLYKLNNMVNELRNEKFNADDLDFTAKALDQILHYLRNGSFVISQPKRFLPVTAQFEINRSDVKNVIPDCLKNHNFLQCILILLAHTSTMNIPRIKVPIYEILSELSLTKEGLDYLSENCDLINVMLKLLLRTEDELQFNLPESLEVKSHNLGLCLAYKLQCLYHIEYLFDLGKKYDCDDGDTFNNLHALFCLCFNYVGKVCVAEVLGIGDNIKCLLRFLEALQNKEGQKLKNSPGIGYVVDLILTAISSAVNVPLMENNAKQILNALSHQDAFDSNLTLKLQEITSFLKPLESNPNYSNITPIVEVINRNLDNVTNFPRQLITALRILQHLGISKHSGKLAVLSENPLSTYIELKYKHVILQLYSLEGTTILTKLLKKISDFYEQPALHTSVFVSNLSLHIMNTIEPTVLLLKQMLTYVIQCRNTKFKDLTSVPVLLETYNLLKSFPTSSPVYYKAQDVCRDIIETLLVYTQPVSEEVQEKDSLNRSLWTRMCGDLIKFTTTAPYSFVSGLLVFSELLPLPLPIQTTKALTKQEISRAVNLRKLWSAHLHSHTNR